MGTRPQHQGDEGPAVRPNWLLDLHRFLGAAAVVLTVIHVGSIVADSYVHFGLVDVLVPFAASWHPAAVAWGVVGLYLLLAVEITSLLRSRLSKRAWRATHFLSFPLFAMATIHGLTAGTDAHVPLLRGGILVGTLGVSALALVRTFQATAPKDQATPRPLGATPRPGPYGVTPRAGSHGLASRPAPSPQRPQPVRTGQRPDRERRRTGIRNLRWRRGRPRPAS